MYRLTYRSSVGRYVGQHIDQLSADITTEICRPTYRPMYQPSYRPSDGRHIEGLSADISVDIAADTRPIRWPICLSVEYQSTVSGISVKSLDCQCQMYKLHAFHPFWSTSKISEGLMFGLHVNKFSRYQARHSSEILPNTQNTVDRKEDKKQEASLSLPRNWLAE